MRPARWTRDEDSPESVPIAETEPATTPRNRFLVVRGGAIGDFILTLPVCSALRHMFPEAEIELLGYPNVTQLALQGGVVDAVRDIDSRPMASFFNRKGHINEELGSYFAGFNVVISYLYDPDFFFQTNVRSCADHIQFVQGIHRPDETSELHATEALLKALEGLAVFGADPEPKLDFGAQDPGGNRRIAVHPGSGSPNKNWPVNAWFELLRDLSDENTVLVVGGEADREQMDVLKAGLDGSRFEFLENQPLVEVGKRLQGCRAFVGHDSGITHLAAAVGLPGVCLWGETSEHVWRPASERFQVLHGGTGLHAITAEQVAAKIRRMLAD